MWILPSHERPHNLKRFFEAYKSTGGSTPGIVCIDATDSRIEDYKKLDYPEGWKLKIYPEMSMVERVNTVFNENPDLDWYGDIDDDSVPTTYEWDKKLVEAAGKDKISHCYNGIGNERIVCQCVIGGEVAKKIGWILLPSTKRIYGDQALTDIGRKLDCIVYLPDVRVEQWHFSNKKAPFDKTYLKPTRNDDRKAYRDWYWKNIHGPLKPLGDELIVCCVMVDDYADRGAEYVNILYKSVERNLTVPHRFICFTDMPHGIECETRPIEGDGWYAKLYLFREFTQGKVIFFDLDTLITGNIDFMDKFNGKFAILRDFYRPNGWGSGVMMWKGGFGHEITQSFIDDGCPEVEGGDQIYIERKVFKAKLLQELYPNKIVSYKVHALTGKPRQASVICFHGFPKPSDFNFGWVKEAWRI